MGLGMGFGHSAKSETGRVDGFENSVREGPGDKAGVRAGIKLGTSFVCFRLSFNGHSNTTAIRRWGLIIKKIACHV